MRHDWETCRQRACFGQAKGGNVISERVGVCGVTEISAETQVPAVGTDKRELASEIISEPQAEGYAEPKG